MTTLFCPICDEEHTLGEHQMSVMCYGCQHELWLEADAEFTDGAWRAWRAWRDQSRLVCYEKETV